MAGETSRFSFTIYFFTKANGRQPNTANTVESFYRKLGGTTHLHRTFGGG